MTTAVRSASSLLIGAFVLACAATPAAQSDVDRVVAGLRTELMQLPYYGVFDSLSVGYDKGTVTLRGYAYSLNLKQSAERAVKRVAGVDEVSNLIEELPASTNDDDIRWRVYYRLYRDPFLARYAPGGAQLWGHQHAYQGSFGRFSGLGLQGFEMAGNYPIRIIVRNSRVTLLGIVDNEADKTVAGMRAREANGTLQIDNELMIEQP